MADHRKRMTTSTAPSRPTLRWDPPGRGDWRGLHDHFPRALTPEYQRLLAKGMEEGEAMYFEHYGLPARSRPGLGDRARRCCRPAPRVLTGIARRGRAAGVASRDRIRPRRALRLRAAVTATPDERARAAAGDGRSSRRGQNAGTGAACRA